MEYLTGTRAFPANAPRHTSKADVVDVSQASFPSSACNKSNGICLWCTWHNGNLLNYCFLHFRFQLSNLNITLYPAGRGQYYQEYSSLRVCFPCFRQKTRVLQSAGVAKVMTELKFVFVFSMLCHVQLQYNILLGNL